MNKFRLLAIALVFGTASLFANSITSPDVSKDEIRQQIIELVDDAQVSMVGGEIVNVTFTFGSEGEIVVLKVDSKDKAVLDFIRKEINSQVLENPGRVNRHYTMPINIK